MVGRVALEPVQRMAADACPGVLRPHLAADGALVRVRVPGGVLSVASLTGLAGVSAELGDGRVGLTSRGNLQVRGIAEASVGLLEQQLSELGLMPHPTHERVRNIIASPLSGRSRTTTEDVDNLVIDLDAALCARAELVALPGRFLIGLDDGTGDIAGEAPDVLVRAVGPGRFAVGAGGVAGFVGVEVGRALVVETVLAAATAFLAEREKQQSKAWRVNELAGGAEAIGQALAGRGPSIKLPAQAAGVIPEPGLIEQQDGRLAVCAVVPLGILEGDHLEALAACCDLSGSDELEDLGELDGLDFVVPNFEGSPLRVTPWRRVLVRDLELPAALAAQELLSAVGLVVEPGAAWARITACAGRPGCAKSLTDVHADAKAFAAECAPDAPRLHWAGCERGCGTPQGAAQLLATPGGYVLGSLGGELPGLDLQALAPLLYKPSQARQDGTESSD